MIDQKAIFQDIYTRLKTNGKFCSPRGLKIIECENFSYELPPTVCFTNFAARKLSVPYVKTEFLWYLKGDLYDLSIGEHAAIWRGIVVKGRLNSNYGFYLFRSPGVGLSWIIDELRRDKDSRRAYAMILGNPHLNVEEKDVPCTMSLGFRIRENKLNMSVRMRSQDAIYGMGNDAPAFAFIHQMVWAQIRWYYPELELGTYHHTSDSFHVYERHFEMLDKIVDSAAEFTPVEYPRIADNYEVNYLLARSLDPAVDNDSHACKDYFEFAKWLLDKSPAPQSASS